MDLLEHRDFVARIARRLVRDEHEVEDVVQETTLAALSGGPKPRAWWARVARNLSIDRLRRRSARRRREEKAARPEGVASTGELAERVAWQQRVVAAVLELEEPYKEVVLLRFYEELRPKEIADRLDTPVNTVNTRLRRALHKLRARLEREAGGRAELFTVLTPLAAYGTAQTAGAGTTAVGAVLGAKHLAAVFALLAMAVTLAAGLALRADGGAARSRTGTLSGRGGAPAAGTARSAAAIPDDVAGVVHADLTGRIPAECADQGGVRVVVRSATRVVHTEIVGLGPMRLRYRHEGEDLRLEFGGPRVLRRTFPLPKRETRLGEVRIQRALTFGGRILDRNGEPIPGAVVYWNQGRARSEPTDEQGRYRIDAPALRTVSRRPDGYLHNVVLHVRKGALWSEAFLAHPRGFELEHEIRPAFEIGPLLRFPDAPGARLTLYPHHHYVCAAPPAALARAATDDAGDVTPYWPPWHVDVVVALRLGNGDRLETILNRQEVCASEPYEVELADTASVRLKVLDGAGRPLAGAKVRVIGDWSPDGLVAEGSYIVTEVGAHEVRLHGVANADGILSWRFPAEKPRTGVFRPRTWTCEHRGRVSHDEFAVRTKKDAALSGGFLKTIVVDEAASARDGKVTFLGSTYCDAVRFTLRGKVVADEGDPGRQRVAHLANGKVLTTVMPDATHGPDRIEFDRVVFTLTTRFGETTVELTRAEWSDAVGGKLISFQEPTPRTAHVRVLGADRHPVANVLVVSSADRATTDADGRATLLIPRDKPTNVFAVHPVTRHAAVLRGWNGQGQGLLRLAKPEKTRFRLVLQNGSPFFGRVTFSSAQGISGTTQVRADRNGWIDTPPLVRSVTSLSAATYYIESKRRHWARLLVELGAVRKNQTLTIPTLSSGGAVRAR